MNRKEIPDSAIELVAEHINKRNSRPSRIPITTIEEESETPHYFEIIAFDQIDMGDSKFFAIDGSYNSQEFYNGLSVGMYSAGYVCFHLGKQVRVNETTDPVALGKSYFPENILITNDTHLEAIYDELLLLKPVTEMMRLFDAANDDVFAFKKDLVCSSLSKLLSFCQEVLEWALIVEIAELPITEKGDFILRDGTLRSNNIKQRFLVKIGRILHNKGLYLLAFTKSSPIKLELSSTFKKLDSFLQDDFKPKYPFKSSNPKWQKLCCWLEVPDDILALAYPEASERKVDHKGLAILPTGTSMFAKKGLLGGRGCGIFFVARLDYVEKLQNYDWVVVDVNIFDAVPAIESGDSKRRIDTISHIFKELTRLTQEHYILGYPYPLVEAHNFITLKNDFKDELVRRLKYSLYKDQRMDNVDIENLFIDIHERF